MQKSSPKEKQLSLLYPDLMDQLDPENEIIVLAKKIPWDSLEKKLSGYYKLAGRPAKSTGLMVGLLILKQLYNLSDRGSLILGFKIHIFRPFVDKANLNGNFPVLPLT